MFEQNQYGAYQGGYNYQGMQPQQIQKFNNTLTADEIKRLRQNVSQFSLSMTDEEYLRGVCNHRSEDGLSDSLIFDPVTGQARCSTCQYSFRPIDADTSLEDIKNSVYDIIDILQTIKLMYVDLPPAASREFFQIIPLLEKVPQLFDFAAKNMTKHETFGWQYRNQNMGAVNMFNNLQNIFGGMAANGGMPMYGQQPMGMPQQQPFYGTGYAGTATPNPGFGYPGASMPQPGMGMSQQPPMMSPVPQSGYQPVNNGFSFTPNPNEATKPVVAESAPEKKGETTVTQQLSV